MVGIRKRMMPREMTEAVAGRKTLRVYPTNTIRISVYAGVKRFFDVVFSAILLAALWPLFLIIAVVIKIDSPGPVLFRQKRTGLKGREFYILKFRSMVSDNDVYDKSCEDKYTRVGKFLRKTSIDELPQLLNVFIGQMSFVGPRPWVPEYWQNMSEEERRRSSVRPGMTGLAAAKGRNGLSVFEKIALDLEYVDNFSLWQDVKVLGMTVGMVLSKEEASAGKKKLYSDIEDLGKRKGNKKRNRSKRVYKNYSVLMSVYDKEKPDFLYQSMQSIYDQAAPTNDFVLVCDGVLTLELDDVIDKMQKKFGKRLRVFRLEKNQELGHALNFGVKKCKNELIARMDSDDIAKKNRCKKQLEVFNKLDVDVVGSNIVEFDERMRNIICSKVVPENDIEIKKYAKRRNPVNHVTAFYKRSKVLESGNYLDMPGFEDYYLWIRMMRNGARFYNVQEVLVDVRGDMNMVRRRGGISYFKQMKKFEEQIKRERFINIFDYHANVWLRMLFSVSPLNIRRVLYNNLLRKNAS